MNRNHTPPTKQTQEIPNGVLLQWHAEFSQNSNSGMLFLLKGRLKDFYNDYEIRIKTILEMKLALQKQWFVFEGDKIKFEEPKPQPLPEKTFWQKNFKWVKQPVIIPQPKQEPKPLMLDGKTYDDFMKLYNELMNETNNIKLKKVPV